MNANSDTFCRRRNASILSCVTCLTSGSVKFYFGVRVGATVGYWCFSLREKLQRRCRKLFSIAISVFLAIHLLFLLRPFFQLRELQNLTRVFVLCITRVILLACDIHRQALISWRILQLVQGQDENE